MADGFNEDWLAQHQAKMARMHAGVATPCVPSPPVDTIRPAGPRESETGGGRAPAGEGVDKAPQTNRKKRPEEDLQKQVATFLDWALPQPLRWFHTPNQRGTRKKWENMLLKAMGVKEGVADVIILGWRTFIWIELKSEKGSLSKAQRDWRDWCRTIGAPWFLCRSLDDVIEALQSLQIRLIARVA